MEQEIEVWKPVPNFEYYEASSFGRVRSLDKIVNGKYGNKALIKGRILKPTLGKKYLMVGLYRNRKNISLHVHVVVASAFHKKPDYKVEVLHLNDIKTDNRAINLKWGTNVENMKSAWANGLIWLPFAWERKSSKHSKDTYINIFNFYNTGKYNPNQIAVMCNYPAHSIYNILKTYRKYKDKIDKKLNLNQ